MLFVENDLISQFQWILNPLFNEKMKMNLKC